MFTIRTVQVFEIETVKEFVENFDFVIRFKSVDSEKKMLFGVHYVDPISKELIYIGTVTLTNEKIQEMTNNGKDFDSALSAMIKADSSIVEPWA